MLGHELVCWEAVCRSLQVFIKVLLTAVTFMESFVETNQVKPKCDDLCDMKCHFHATKVMENEHLA